MFVAATKRDHTAILCQPETIACELVTPAETSFLEFCPSPGLPLGWQEQWCPPGLLPRAQWPACSGKQW